MAHPIGASLLLLLPLPSLTQQSRALRAPIYRAFGFNCQPLVFVVELIVEDTLRREKLLREKLESEEL